MSSDGKTEASHHTARSDIETLRNAFAAAPFGMALIGRKGRCLHANPAACAILGRTENELRAENLLSIVHPDSLERGFAAVEQFRDGAVESFDGEVKCFHPRAGSIWLHVGIAAVRGEEGAVAHYLTHLEDITQGKRVALEKEQLQDAVRRAETMAAMGALVGGVAHEVRNPLFGITATLDAMDNRLGHLPEHERYVKVLRSEATRMTELMQRLLALGRPVSSELQHTTISEVLRAAADICSIAAADKQVKVELAVLDSADYTMEVDKPRLIGAFQNLIDNAIQFSAPGGEVMVRVRRIQEPDGGYALVTVRDAGSGFTGGDEARIFQPFFTKRPGGTGLGLSIVKQTIEEHKGKISASNHPEGGAELSVRLPLPG